MFYPRRIGDVEAADAVAVCIVGNCERRIAHIAARIHDRVGGRVVRSVSYCRVELVFSEVSHIERRRSEVRVTECTPKTLVGIQYVIERIRAAVERVLIARHGIAPPVAFGVQIQVVECGCFGLAQHCNHAFALGFFAPGVGNGKCQYARVLGFQCRSLCRRNGLSQSIGPDISVWLDSTAYRRFVDKAVALFPASVFQCYRYRLRLSAEVVYHYISRTLERYACDDVVLS